MPRITNLTCSPPLGGDPVSVSVSCDLTFDPTEDGKPYQVTIEIVADDSTLLAGPAVLHTFAFGGWPLPPRPYKTIIAKVGGVHIDETRSIARAKLNEDPEIHLVPVDPHTPPLPMPEPDEYRARVTVRQVTQALSAVQSILV